MLSAIAFCVALGFGIVVPALPVFAKSFGVSAFLAAAVISVFALMRLIGAPIAGRLINRTGERLVLASGLIIVAVSSALAGLSQSYVQLLVLRGFGGVGSAMFTVSAMALLLRTAGADQRGRAAGAFQAGFLFGGIAGPAVGGLVVGISIRAPFFFYAGTLALATFVTLVYLRNPEVPVQKEFIEQEPSATPDTDEQPVSDLDAPEPEVAPVSLTAALSNSGYRAALMANLSNGYVSFGIRSSLVPLFVVEYLKRGPSLSAIGFLLAAIAQGIALLPAGRIADLRGRRPAMIAGALVSLAGITTLMFSNGPVIFCLAMAVTGIGTAFFGSAPAAVVGDVMGEHRGGTVVAVFQMISDVGSIVGPLVAGFLADRYGYHAALATAVGVMAVATIFAVVMRETRFVSEAETTEATT